MSERLAFPETISGVDALTREERRKIRRVGVNLQVRIRTADFEDGDFEEIRTTLNASKKAVYFFTPLNGYYKGMKLRIAFPYNAHGSANLEQPGEVIRVHRRGTGFGVAVALKAESEAAKPRGYGEAPVAQLAPQGIQPNEERRCAKRISFVAPVELMETRSGSRIKARIADLSPQGCYVDTLNPLAVGSEVRLQIQQTNESLDLLARVSSQHAGSGMGLEFGETTPEQRAMLKSWLGKSSRVGFIGPHSPAKQNTHADQAYVTRLINALVRKGILSKSEATELLRDPEG